MLAFCVGNRRPNVGRHPTTTAVIHSQHFTGRISRTLALPIDASIIAHTASHDGDGCFELDLDPICTTRTIDVTIQMMPTPKIAIMLTLRMKLSRRCQSIRKGKIMTAQSIRQVALLLGRAALTRQIRQNVYREGIVQADDSSSSISFGLTAPYSGISL